MSEILGRKIDLPEGRFVFFAAADETYYLGFRNQQGQQTRLSLSREAKDALRALLSDPEAGLPLAECPDEQPLMMWKYVSTT